MMARILVGSGSDGASMIPVRVCLRDRYADSTCSSPPLCSSLRTLACPPVVIGPLCQSLSSRGPSPAGPNSRKSGQNGGAAVLTIGATPEVQLEGRAAALGGPDGAAVPTRRPRPRRCR